jgi:hypothetical protein
MVDVRLDGALMRFEDVKSGTLFAFWREGTARYGLAVEASNRRAAIMFFRRGPGQPAPWLALGGLPSGAVLSLPTAIVRLDHRIVTKGTRLVDVGVITKTVSSTYVEAYDTSGGDVVAFDLITGAMDEPPSSEPMLSFAKWEAGFERPHGAFEQLFAFPIAES